MLHRSWYNITRLGENLALAGPCMISVLNCGLLEKPSSAVSRGAPGQSYVTHLSVHTRISLRVGKSMLIAGCGGTLHYLAALDCSSASPFSLLLTAVGFVFFYPSGHPLLLKCCSVSVPPVHTDGLWCTITLRAEYGRVIVSCEVGVCLCLCPVRHGPHPASPLSR